MKHIICMLFQFFASNAVFCPPLYIFSVLSNSTCQNLRVFNGKKYFQGHNWPCRPSTTDFIQSFLQSHHKCPISLLIIEDSITMLYEILNYAHMTYAKFYKNI